MNVVIVIAIVGIVGVSLFMITQNYDISVNNQPLGEIIPLDSIENTVGDITDSIEGVSESIPVKIEPKSTSTKPQMTQKEIDALRADWMKNRFSDKYRIIEMDCPNHPLKPGHLVFGGDDVILDAIFERCIMP